MGDGDDGGDGGMMGVGRKESVSDVVLAPRGFHAPAALRLLPWCSNGGTLWKSARYCFLLGARWLYSWRTKGGVR